MTSTLRKSFTSVRTALLSLTLVVGVSAGLVAGSWMHDSRLDDADAALEKAYFLLLASEAGVVDVRVERAFDRHVRKALAAIEGARNATADAIAVVDGAAAPGGIDVPAR